MLTRIQNRILVVIFLLLCLLCGCGKADEEQVFYGVSDVSAAVWLDMNHFVTTDDETNFLRVYDINKPENPVSRVDLNAFLTVDSASPEADIEGAARVGDRIYWITSHGRNKNGKLRPSRHCFFCTEVKTGPNGPQLEPTGQVCTNLMRQFLTQPSPAKDIIARASRFEEPLSKKERQELAPKEEGLNIEGLGFYPPHESLLIGLRNPLFAPPGKKGGAAIVLELLNPQAMADEAAAAQFGRVVFWNLSNRGIRSIEYSRRFEEFFILAGPVNSETTFAMFRWDGDFEHQPKWLYEWHEKDSFKPEGIAERVADGTLWLFSDDGTLEIQVASADACQPGELLDNGKCPNKYLTDPARKTFRVRTYTPDTP